MVMVGAMVNNGAQDIENSRCYAAEKVIKEQKQIIDSLIKKMDQMEKRLPQKHEEIAARLSDTIEKVVEPLVEKVNNLEMENESRKKSEANSCSLVAELVAKVDKMSVSVRCLSQDSEVFRSGLEQKITALRKDMEEEMDSCAGMEWRGGRG